MPIEQTLDQLRSLLRELCRLPSETEWVEFKHNNVDPETIGEYISALANSAALLGKQCGYVVWGVENDTHDIVGTTFNPANAKVVRTWPIMATSSCGTCSGTPPKLLS